MSWKLLVVWILFHVTFCDIDPIQIMSDLSSTIGTYILECWDETNFNQMVIKEFLSYWDESIPLVDPDMGCVVMWILHKLELVENNGTLRTENAKAFMRAKGSDVKTSEALIKLYALCLRSTDLSPGQDECEFGLLLAQCFRQGVTMLGWTPRGNSPDMYNEEITDLDDYL